MVLKYTKELLSRRRNQFIAFAALVMTLLAGGGAWWGYSNYREREIDSNGQGQELTPVDPSEVDTDLVASTNEFGFDIFGSLYEESSSQNLFISPSSIHFALAMTYNGAEGQTKEEMAEVLHISAAELEELNEDSLKLIQYLENLDPKVQLAIANSLWAADGRELDSDFQSRVESSYSAEVSNVDFGSQAGIDEINDWVKEQTNSKIESILDNPNSNMVLALLNAIYFKGSWTEEFDPGDTAEEDFVLPGGDTTGVNMMHQSGDYYYTETDDFQMVRLPYGDEKLAMYVVLPAEDSSLPDFCTELNEGNWSEWTSQLAEKEGDIGLPKFKVEYETSLNDALKALGMPLAFSPSADFSKMFGEEGIWIDEVKHKTFVEVNEEGTEAAAVTSVTMVESAPPPTDKFEMVVDRPFFYAIQDIETGAILFMGTTSSPQE